MSFTRPRNFLLRGVDATAKAHVEILACAATLTAGVMRTSVGIGAGIFLTACLSLVFDPKMTLAIMAFLQIGFGASAVWHYWRQWDARLAARLITSAIVGVALGTWFITVLPPDWFRRIFGLGLTALGLLQLFGPATYPIVGTRGIFTFGFVAGIAGAMANAAGAILTLYLRRLQLSYDVFIGTLSAAVMCTDALRLAIYWRFGLLNEAAFQYTLLLLPLALVGGWLGTHVRLHVPELWLRNATLSLVVVIGIMLLV